MQQEEQISLEMLEREILQELNMPEAVGLTAPPTTASHINAPPTTTASHINAPPAIADQTQIDPSAITDPRAATRKSYQIKDFENPRDKEMAVFTHAKKLSEYIFVITEKSPKKYRWSIISRLQNASVELVENLYRANFERDEAVRVTYQKAAAVCIKLIDFYAETARKKQAITVRQTAVLARHLAETEKLLNGWVRSTRRKL